MASVLTSALGLASSISAWHSLRTIGGYPNSTAHELLHPSPDMVFPSSHSSPASRWSTPSPHFTNDLHPGAHWP